MEAEQIRQVRLFQRIVSQRTGALHDRFLGRDRPMGASRVLYEIGSSGADLRDLCTRLDLDSGYLTRLIHDLVSEGLASVETSPDDERVRHASLTAAGRAEVEEMNRRADQLTVSLLENLDPAERQRLLDAMAVVCRLLQISGLRIERVEPDSPEARWCIEQYFEELRRRFEGGFDPSLVLPTDEADLRPPRGVVMVASIDGAWVACASLKTLTPGVGYLKRMWVDGSLRGMGIGRRLLAAMESEARQLGMTTLRLETNRALVEAIRMYRHLGYDEVPPFNAEPYAHHWFEKHLT